VLALHFDDGSADVVIGSDADAVDLYNALWLLAGTVNGAVSAAAKVQHARAYSSGEAPSDQLSLPEGRAVRAALETLRPPTANL
jgi:hypothetical protein